LAGQHVHINELAIPWVVYTHPELSGVGLTEAEAQAKFGVVKVSPLANWTKAKIWDLIVKENIPYNPLHDQGYVSIGCWPCTRAVTAGEDERAGRWSGTAKTECGLHSK
jgi:phosphoadenylyl-sulfate reductase (thioredoxin)